jgi:hypothetical protein
MWRKGLKALHTRNSSGCGLTPSVPCRVTGDHGNLGMVSISCMQVVVHCKCVFHLDLCTLERQSLCESHRQRRWLTCWSYCKALASQENAWQRRLAHLLPLTPCTGVHRARLIPRSRGPLVTACLSYGSASRQSQDKNEEESHGNRNAGDR